MSQLAVGLLAEALYHGAAESAIDRLLRCKGQKLDSHPARCCGSFSVRIAGVVGSILVCIPIPEILQIR